jgi:predicted dehydrogenase
MPLRVGIVGFEPGTHFSAYLAALEGSPVAELAAVALRPELRPPLAPSLEPFGARAYPEAAALLDGERLDVLALCTVPDEQGALVLEGLRRGLHVVADKPLVTEPDDLTRVRRVLAGHPELRLSMLLTLRGDPVRGAARRLLREGRLGRLAMLHSRRAYAQRRDSRPDWFFDAARSGGPWADGAIHGLDEVLWLAGRRPQEVTAYDSNVSWPGRPRFFDHGQALLRLEGGATAIVEHHRLALNDCWLAVLGSTAKVEVDRHGRGVFVDAAGEHPLEEVVPLEPPVNVFADFLTALATERPALVDTADVLATMAAVFATRAAAETGRRIAFPENEVAGR